MVARLTFRDLARPALAGAIGDMGAFIDIGAIHRCVGILRRTRLVCIVDTGCIVRRNVLIRWTAKETRGFLCIACGGFKAREFVCLTRTLITDTRIVFVIGGIAGVALSHVTRVHVAKCEFYMRNRIAVCSTAK